MIKYDWTSGLVFGQLTLTGKSYLDGKRRFVETICTCETIKWVRWDGVKEGRCKSCGCLPAERMRTLKPATTHGLYQHPLYFIFQGVKKRCLNKNCKKYPIYGGAGVKICPEWLADFKNFYDWAIDKWKPGLEIDKDILYKEKFGTKTGLLYSPEFCQFVTGKVNCGTKTTNRKVAIFGEEKNLIDWIDDERCVVKYTVALKRLNRGWDGEKAITTPTKDNGYSGSPLN